MSSRASAQSWYRRDDVVDEYKATLQEDDEKLPMLKALSVSRAIVLNAGLIAG